MFVHKLKLLKFDNKRKEEYSDKWLLKINPLAIAKYIQEREGYRLSWRAVRAMANAEIAACYKDLVLEEEESNLNNETIAIKQVEIERKNNSRNYIVEWFRYVELVSKDLNKYLN